MPNDEYFSQALYMFDIGQNNLTAKYYAYNKSAYEVIPDALQLLSYVIKVALQLQNIVHPSMYLIALFMSLRMSSLMQTVYVEGGRFFWIHNTGPLGCLPAILTKEKLTAQKYDAAGCVSPFNEVARLLTRC